jgi:ribonuclease E
MPKKMLIDATHPEETRVVVVDGNKVEEFDFESSNKRQISGNIYLAKVTRVEPSLQAAFVEYGGNRHGFLAFSEIHPDYYQIPVADREALLAAEEAAQADEDDEPRREPKPKARARNRRRGKEGRDDGAAPSAGDDDAGSEDDGANVDAPRGPASIAEDAGTDGVESVSEDIAAEGEGKPKRRRRRRKTDEKADGAEVSNAGTADAESESEAQVENVGAEAAEEEKPVRRAPPRRYKIQEVVKVRQIMLVQVVKEERGNKGAALTTYLSLAGRYCVLMPNTARGGGISRKITSAEDRKKLKEIAAEFEVPKGMGIIIRTAGSQRTRTEIKRDYEFLLRQWEEIRELTLKSIAPALIYEEGSLIKRSIRDLYSKDIDEVLVEGDEGYREAKDYMRMLMPSHAKNVQPYKDAIPLFSRHQVESYLAAMFNPVVQLKSGGYIVIGVTEALVAIDVNSGRSTREGSIEETALKTNLEAADEVARQLRLRDLAGLIVIDFIDMNERRNNAAVEKRMKDRLASDRARIQIGKISAFGLMEMSRQRLRPGMLEASTAPCPHCHGSGLIRSQDSLALSILREIEEEAVRRRASELRVVAPVAVANYIINQKREHLLGIEARYGLRVLMEGDPALISPEHRVERLKAAVQKSEPAQQAVRAESTMAAFDDPRGPEPDDEDDEAPAAEQRESGGGQARREESAESKARRRRGKRGGRKRRRDDAGGAPEDERRGDAPASMAVVGGAESGDAEPMTVAESPFGAEIGGAGETAEIAPAPAETPRSAEPETLAEPAAEEAPAPKPKRRRTRKAPAAEAPPADSATEVAVETASEATPPAGEEEGAAPAADAPAQAVAVETAPTASEPAPEPEPAVAAAETPAATDNAEEERRPRRRGWWNIGGR